MKKLKLSYSFYKSSYNFSGKSIFLVDSEISIINGQLKTTVYSKPTDSHLYLHTKSCHKASPIRDIQKGLPLHFWRICSTDNEFWSKSGKYQDYLNRRGHDSKTVHDTFEKLTKITQMMQERRRLVIAVTTNELFF